MEEIFCKIKTYNLALAFNGGKESIVTLHLAKKYLKNFNDIIFFRINNNKDFEELNNYINKTSKLYNIELIEYHDYKLAIENLKEQYNVDGIIMGNRKTDPGCEKLTTFKETDNGWPKIIRINPLLNWTYKDVWDYIISNDIDCCELYKKGYTSIGNRYNTFPNYYLFQSIEKGYKHAKYLSDETIERLCRIKTHLPKPISGKVVKGKQLGRKLGFPTANLDIKADIPEGVYYGTAMLNGESHLMVMSVGQNIHFNADTKTIEVHILNKYNEEFYGKILNVYIIGFIRKMEKYTNDQNLIESIKKDIEICKFHM